MGYFQIQMIVHPPHVYEEHVRISYRIICVIVNQDFRAGTVAKVSTSPGVHGCPLRR